MPQFHDHKMVLTRCRPYLSKRAPSPCYLREKLPTCWTRSRSAIGH